MYAKELKAQVQHDAYVVDTQLVAEALLRAAVKQRITAASLSRRGARDHATSAARPRPRFQT
jgi:hypothetical protein